MKHQIMISISKKMFTMWPREFNKKLPWLFETYNVIELNCMIFKKIITYIE